MLTLCMVLCLVSTSVFAEDNMAASGTAEVSTAAELVSAIREASYGTVKLTSDITIYTTLVVNRTVTLDLNGYVLAPFKIILILAFNFFHSKNRPISFYKLPLIIKSCKHIILLQTRKTNEKEIRK